MPFQTLNYHQLKYNLAIIELKLLQKHKVTHIEKLPSERKNQFIFLDHLTSTLGAILRMPEEKKAAILTGALIYFKQYIDDIYNKRWYSPITSLITQPENSIFYSSINNAIGISKNNQMENTDKFFYLNQFRNFIALPENKGIFYYLHHQMTRAAITKHIGQMMTLKNDLPKVKLNATLPNAKQNFELILDENDELLRNEKKAEESNRLKKARGLTLTMKEINENKKVRKIYKINENTSEPEKRLLLGTVFGQKRTVSQKQPWHLKNGFWTQEKTAVEPVNNKSLKIRK